MKILYASAFERRYRKLSLELRKQVDRAIEIFIANPFDPKLRNHKLSGAKKTVRSISAGFDLRILYKEIDEHRIVLLVAVGTHEDVY